MTDRTDSGKVLDVLIAGAGPTGLTLACVLARRGVRFRILDMAPRPAQGSRGKGLQPRSLELFNDLGIVEKIIAHGTLGLPVRNYDLVSGSQADRLPAGVAGRPDAPYGASLITPQWRIEATLREKLGSLGGQVEFGCELVGCKQDADAVDVQLVGTNGPATQRARWLVGCDGGKSTVRHLAGISFLGETLETHRMLIADVRAAGLDRQHWHMWRSAEGFLALCPLPSTEQFQFQASIAPGQESEATLETLQSLLERRTRRVDIRLSDPAWMSLWRANIRMVDRYRSGQIFLAGDAAHVHSPAGGQGMNTGIQDAYNLGWKMAAVLDGAESELLDSYQQERLPVAAWVLGVSTELMAQTVSSGTIAFRNDQQTQQLGIGYRESGLSLETRPEVQGLRAGDRAPEAPGLVGSEGPCSVFDLLRGPHVTLLGFGSQWQPLLDECVAKFGDHVHGHVIAVQSSDKRSCSDLQGHARAAYAEDTLFVVRPDNYIGMVNADADSAQGASAVMQYLTRITGIH